MQTVEALKGVEKAYNSVTFCLYIMKKREESEKGSKQHSPSNSRY